MSDTNYDRWTINLALEMASEVFRVTSLVNSHDLYQVRDICQSSRVTTHYLCPLAT
jgi:hypothetical protein